MHHLATIRKKQLALSYAQCNRDDYHYIIWTEARLLAMPDTEFRQRVNALYVENHRVIAHRKGPHQTSLSATHKKTPMRAFL
ncbi:hypothetical protein [Dyella sp.]|uniref:hypothetical protein n=1 Tax=Dyella sp. TaxID=1869338 RepID=UPI002D79C7E4|nr:hypothetical protein [Dyella sp.]HET7332204.1 hypothetical protein [Dyella sp.]